MTQQLYCSQRQHQDFTVVMSPFEIKGVVGLLSRPKNHSHDDLKHVTRKFGDATFQYT